VVRRAILDKDVRVPAGLRIGVDPEEDAARGLTVSAAGVTVVPKGFEFDEVDLPVAGRVARVH
jgi:glucose-1-phosphate adenylyltransferase